MKTFDFLKIILRGVSQVMLQNNFLTGILFLIGIFYNSWLMGLGALLGVFCSTITAFILHYEQKDIDDGLYGFNGTLVGIALLFFFQFNYFSIILIIFGSILSSVIMNFMWKRKLAPYTFPFVFSTWFLLIVIKLFPLLQSPAPEVVATASLNFISSLSLGFGQVMFQASLITGILFFSGILINSRRAAMFGFLGSLIGVVIGAGLSFPLNLVNAGIFGFNGVLCGIAFAEEKKRGLTYAIISIILSVFIMKSFLAFNLIALTAPFVFAVWISLGLRKLIQK